MSSGLVSSSPTQEDMDAFVNAARSNSIRAIEYHLSRFSGAILNAKDIDGCTALMGAAERDHIEAASLLIEAGANIDEKDDEGDDTALTVAEKSGSRRVAGLIRSILKFREEEMRRRQTDEAALAIYAGITEDIEVAPLRFKKKGPSAF
jgi:ankyrin repeat protein